MLKRTKKVKSPTPSKRRGSKNAPLYRNDGLCSIALQAQAGSSQREHLENFGFALRNFLDQFYAAPLSTKHLLLQGGVPSRLRAILKDDGVADAYLAALATHLANMIHISPPAWAASESRRPAKPWFALNSPEARIWLLTQSPAAFRERNLFISEDALSRAEGPHPCSISNHSVKKSATFARPWC